MSAVLPKCGCKKFDRNCKTCMDFLFENGGWQYIALGMSKKQECEEE